MAKDTLGEIFTEKRGGRLVQVRRLIVGRNAVEGILAEVSSATKLSHPLILRPLDASADGGLVTIVTETLEGRTLRGLLTTLAATGEKLPVSHATWIALQLLEALEHAHSRNDGAVPMPVFHGRISPEHVVLTASGQVRLTGFGLDAACRHLLKPEGKTDPTFAYVAPEQTTAEPLNASSDVFAVMSVLAEAVLGKALFLEDTFAKTWEAIANRPLPVLRQARDGVPKALDEAMAWACERNLARRCPRPEALKVRLEAFQGVLDVGDRVKPDEHARRIADLIRLRMKGVAPGAAVDVTSMEPVSTAAPEKKPSRKALRFLQLVFVSLAAAFFVGVWAKWEQLEEPVRRSIPPQVATALGIEPAYVPPPPPPVEEVDAGAAEPADAGLEEPDAGAPPPPPPPKPALVTIQTTPAKAEATLDGKPLGTTPLVDVEVPPGEHVLELRAKKLKLSQKLVIGEGETKKLTLKLKKR